MYYYYYYYHHYHYIAARVARWLLGSRLSSRKIFRDDLLFVFVYSKYILYVCLIIIINEHNNHNKHENHNLCWLLFVFECRQRV